MKLSKLSGLSGLSGKLLTGFSLLLLLSISSAAQMPSPAAQRAEMKKLDYMVGQWRGTGWIEQGGPRQTYAGTETVQSKLQGVGLLVEGKFKGKLATTGEEAILHETLAVITYDERTKGYRFQSYLASGLAGAYDLKLTDNGWQWQLRTPGGDIRYTAAFSGGEKWVETGEISMDGGKTYRKFLEMTLEKVK